MKKCLLNEKQKTLKSNNKIVKFDYEHYIDACGGMNNYDANGHKVGHSSPGFFGGMNHYDNNGHKTGHSSPGLFGGVNTYDNNGHKKRHSEKSFLGGYNHYEE